MKKTINRVEEPCAFVTMNRKRIKQYDKTVYLSNGKEFEIELFNPTTNKVLAQIELDGKSLGSGVVLRPGERVFLERYFDNARKFLFETYNVDGNNQDVMDAIQNNGSVVVKFYEEKIYYNSWNTTYVSPGAPVLEYDFSNYPVYGPSTLTRDTTGTFYSSTSNSVDMTKQRESFANHLGKGKKRKRERMSALNAPTPIETGRVEKGSVSDQSFSIDNTQFYNWYSWTSEWNILPLSRKPMTSKEINKVYCTNCGMQRKKSSANYCSNCGTRYE